MNGSVFDSSAIIAFFEGEPGADRVETLLLDASTPLYIHALNLTEVHYHLIRSQGAPQADAFIQKLSLTGLLIRMDLDAEICREAAKLKARGRISLADCFCIALAQRVGGEVVTTDHHEFDALIPLNLCPIQFIR
jgi:predicted nucleic acid-binding protein